MTCPLSGSSSDTHPNNDVINYNYTIPANVPFSNTLANGNYYKLIVFLKDDVDGTANGSVNITISSTGNNSKITANLNAKHSVGNVETLDRSKFITIHANQTENEWNGTNFTSDLRDHFLNGYDVYMGRDTGGVSWYSNQMQEDPSRTGYANPEHIASLGLNRRNAYASQTNLHQYEARNTLILGAQKYPFWTGEGQKATNQGWSFANGTATGEYMGRYINEFHGNNGQPVPEFVEIINEPAYEHLGGPEDYTNSLQEVADFHNDVAIAIKAQAPNVKVGGYTAAFPNFEKGDFQRWINRDKLFMDVAGNNMDFWSIHLYDFPSIGGGQKKLRSGSNVEATFDMMEQYSYMSFGEVKPFVISEYGAQMHDYSKQQWSPYRDWLHLKAQNAQLMSFLDRPNHIASAINFVIVKAEWGYNNGIPYNHRLMRKENEPTSYTGQWVYTDMVKFYQLWSNVNGTRIDTFSDNLDVQVDGYVDGNKAYVVLNNLNFTDEEIDLNLIETDGLSIASITKKYLYLDGSNLPQLLEESIAVNTSTVTLNAESTMVLEYTFNNTISINESNTETKYYATTYLQPIVANQEVNFQLNAVSTNAYGEAVLRVGIGRIHGLSLRPSIKVNGTLVDVPNNWRGDDQAQRERFFGVLEIPVPFDLIQTNNIISVEFGDTGGHISTVSLQVFNFSSDLRSQTLSVNNTKLTSSMKIYPNPTTGVISIKDAIHYKQISVYSISGKVVKTFKSDKVIDISNLANGIYFLKTDTGYNFKVLKK
ncbi:T9SS type A sorting domain-containing protein [Algibacter amylolyticus]|uniref:T9SS type A sorting domain-containing protein n=1 Tax=Algibacter amylolyticus TaxID=1608400 RepID=A0A5M7B7Z6_9FLAO|nr:T9SS type A sorting domain-containing protein [Algibacter amylolyticus]KAA5823704.1 T9SS type A sorting domain-containing protein [Algibacter amylolyticus]MBB5267874.1 agarase [Algibacter amylolyticus]TSJ74192.1 T9SS type A sorting domain-containing protein [Algibacter amylolyticus]